MRRAVKMLLLRNCRGNRDACFTLIAQSAYGSAQDLSRHSSHIYPDFRCSRQGPKGDKGDRYVQTFDNNSLVTFAEGPPGLPGPPGVIGPPGRKVQLY